MDAREKVCLVVGGASGMGRLAAQRWSRAGGTVAAADIDTDGLRETADGFDSIHTWPLDVTNRAEVRRMAERWARQLVRGLNEITTFEAAIEPSS